MHVLWLRPDKPENISVHCHRIGLELENRGHKVEIRNTTPKEFHRVIDDSPDAIVGTTRLGAIVGTWKKALSGIPLLIDHIDPISQLRRSHGPVTTWGISQAEKLSFRIADHVMVVYDEEFLRVSRHSSRVTETSLGVEYDRFASPPEDTVQQAQDAVYSQVPTDEQILLYVGGLEPTYHIPTILDTMDHLDEWHFVVLGDGSQRELLEDAASNREDTHYLGTVPYERVPGYMHVADVGISLPDDENTLKILEYGAAGLPAVHLEGSAESVLGERVTYCSLEPAEIAHAIEKARTADTEGLREFARDRSWEAVTDQYEEVLESIV